MSLNCRFLLALVFGLVLPCFGQAPIHFTFFEGGSPQGKLELSPQGINGWNFHHTRLIRGWKDDLQGKAQFDAHGLLRSFSVEGESDSVKGFEERFERSNTTARWSTPAEKGSTRRVKGFYLSQVAQIQPLFNLWLAQTLMRTPSRPIPLLPTGEARLGEARMLDVQETHGVRSLKQIRIEGVGYEPSFVWYAPSGEAVAVATNYYMIVREGWEQRFHAFDESKNMAIQALDRQRGPAARLAMGSTFAVKGVKVFDAQTRQTLMDQTVLVKDGRIKAMGPSASVEIPKGTQVIDGRGKTLIPGMWNSHQHSDTGYGQASAIAMGITGAHDPGADPRTQAQLLRDSDADLIPGPRVLPSLLLDGTGPNTAQVALIVDTPEDVLLALDRAKREGYIGVKLYGSLKPDLVPAIIKGGRERGLWVSGHVPAGLTAWDVIPLGFQEIHHLNFAMLALWPELKDKTNGMTRFTAIGERTHALDLQGPEVQRLIAFLKEHGTVVDPTLVVFIGILDHAPGTPNKLFGALEPRLPAVPRRIANSEMDLAANPEERKRNQASLRKALGFVKELHTAGVPLVLGTDGADSFQYAHELSLFVEAGIPTAEVMCLATLGSAKIFGRDKDTGSIEVGKLADMVLVDGNPAEHIEDLERIVWTCKGGVIYDREKLLSAMGLLPAPPK